MTLKESKTQLLSLTPTEKIEAIQILSHSLSQSWRGITKIPGVCGDDACIADTRIPVWVLVEAQELGLREPQLLYDYPTLSATDLANAWIYASANPEEIATAIQANEAWLCVPRLTFTRIKIAKRSTENQSAASSPIAPPH